MKYTSRLNLKKPEGTDPALISDINDNMDMIDSAITTTIDDPGSDTRIPTEKASRTMMTTHVSADDHTQYLNTTRHDTTDRHTPGTVVPVVTSIGDPGSDSNIPSEKAVRSAITSITSVTDHGALTGLDDDDHPQYLDTSRHDTTERHGSAVVDHGSIGGLGDDDHPQYLNTTRHDTTDRHTPGTVVPVVTSVGSPGSNSNIPSEAAVRSAVDVHKYRNLQVHLDGGTSAIPTGWRGSIVVPINCTITGWYLLADASGSISLTVTKTTYSDYPTGSSILTPSLSSAQKGSASGLSISCSKDDILTVTVNSCSTIKFCELVLVTVVS